MSPQVCSRPRSVHQVVRGAPKYATPTHQQFLGPAVSLADDGNEPQFVGCVFVGNCVHPKSVTKVDAINALKSLSMVFLTIKDREIEVWPI